MKAKLEKIISIIIDTVQTEKLFLLHELKEVTFSPSEGHADYYFLVLTRDEKLSYRYHLEEMIESACLHIAIINITVFDVHLFCFFLRGQAYFFPELESAKLLYDYGHVPLPRRPPLQTDFVAQQLRHAFRYYMATAEQFYRIANASWIEGIRNVNVISNCIRYIYSAIEVVFTGYNSESHNLYWLRQSTARFSEEVAILFPYHSQKEKHLLYLLNKVSLNRPIKGKKPVSRQEYEVMLHRIEEMSMITLIVCPEHINRIQLFTV